MTWTKLKALAKQLRSRCSPVSYAYFGSASLPIEIANDIGPRQRSWLVAGFILFALLVALIPLLPPEPGKSPPVLWPLGVAVLSTLACWPALRCTWRHRYRIGWEEIVVYRDHQEVERVAWSEVSRVTPLGRIILRSGPSLRLHLLPRYAPGASKLLTQIFEDKYPSRGDPRENKRRHLTPTLKRIWIAAFLVKWSLLLLLARYFFHNGRVIIPPVGVSLGVLCTVFLHLLNEALFPPEQRGTRYPHLPPALRWVFLYVPTIAFLALLLSSMLLLRRYSSTHSEALKSCLTNLTFYLLALLAYTSFAHAACGDYFIWRDLRRDK